jgi:hypothetical protein
MAYYLLFMGKAGICRGASPWRNNGGWHDVVAIGRPESGSGYRHDGRDEMHRRVQVKMTSQMRGGQVDELLWRRAVAPYVAIEEAYDGKGRYWWTFFDVSSAGWSTGTDYDSPTKSTTLYTFEFGSARWGSGAWPGAIRLDVSKIGYEPRRAVDRETNQAITALPVPSSLKRRSY